MTVVSVEVPDADRAGVPEIGQLVRVRGQQWVVSDVSRSHQPADELAAAVLPGRTLVRLTSVSDDDLGEELTLVWEIEPDREIVPATKLPDVTDSGWDDPQVLGAFLDAVRWGTVTSADTKTLQAPFRSGISIEEYQLEPVARALAMPRVNLLIADDVGLGKTVEAGLVMQEMHMTGRANLAELTSRKGWIDFDYDQTIWIPCPSGFPPEMTRDQWAHGYAQIWWDASGRKHGKREVQNMEKMLIAIQQTIYSEQPCHLALLNMPGVQYAALPVCMGIWQAIGEIDEQLRTLVHAEEPAAVQPPAVEEIWTDRLGRGLKSLYYQRQAKSRGLLAVLNYAWRSEEHETAVHIYTAWPDWGRLQQAIPDINEMTKTISIVASPTRE